MFLSFNITTPNLMIKSPNIISLQDAGKVLIRGVGGTVCLLSFFRRLPFRFCRLKLRGQLARELNANRHLRRPDRVEVAQKFISKRFLKP